MRLRNSTKTDNSRDQKTKATQSNLPVQLSTEREPDPTLNFFYKPHTVTVLLAMLGVLIYVAFWKTEQSDPMGNAKIGLVMASGVFLLIGLLMFHDGPFIRPHPAFWRVVLAASTLYQLFLVFILFQSKYDARQYMKFFDQSLGKKLPERNYATDCSLTYDNIYNQVDIFVIAHVFGWVAKAILIRDYWICWILSVMFEVMEYSLQHQLPNFAECWWDHWILDVFLCNWIGLEIGMKLCEFFELKTYSWAGIRQIPTYSGKVKRAVAQFTPYSWTKFEWEANKSFTHFATVVLVITMVLICELNAFYLKYLLWVPPPNLLNVYRLLFYFFSGVVALREVYQYLQDPNCKRLGAQAWITIANVLTEAMVNVKFGKDEFHVPTPWHVSVFWSIFMILLIIYTVVQFVIFPYQSKQSSKRK